MKWKALAVVVGLLALGLILVGCGATPEPCPECPAAPECPECPAAECPECPAPEACPEASPCPECPAAPEGTTGTAACPFQEEWAGSAHADAEAEAFIHWNEDDPKEVPAGCAQCHSTTGYQAYVAGVQEDLAFELETGVPVGEVVNCNACHDAAALTLSTIPFPSGITLTVEGPTVRCMVCHQGRASGVQVDAKIADAGVPDDDTVSGEITFSNIHYKAAAATLYGSVVKGGYEYADKAYDPKFAHEPGIDTCVDCHNQHTLELKVESCFCHELETAEDARNIREAGSLMDYDGDGDVEEGMYYEVQGLQESLLQAIQMYATEVSTQAIVYDAASYPYFFGDDNANGAVDEGEAAYKGWTGRLSKAAYNYQFSLKDPGSYAHNGKYIVELLYDSIEDLNTKLATPIDMSTMHRNDAGHFDASAEPWRHWDEDPAVEPDCVKCHQAEGVPQFIESEANVAMPQSSSMECGTCHNTAAWPARYEVTEVEFPSGAAVTFENLDSNLCLMCHQGRRAPATTIDPAIEGLELDTPTEELSFSNAHYFVAGATLFGADVQAAYQYEGKEYAGRNTHVEGFNDCTQCHDVHMLSVKVDSCKACHPSVEGEEDLAGIRMSTTDFDGDGDTTEGITGEVSTMVDALYAAIQAYAQDTAGTPIVYDAHARPYFFIDANANGTLDEGETDRYVSFTPRLLKAAWNLDLANRDPGNCAHNSTYVMQFLYDSIEDLGGDVSGFTRP